MIYKLLIRPLAAIEIIDAFDWYDLQREGLGNKFLQQLDILYETLLQNPHTLSYYEKPIRQGKINRFPYIVVYEVFDSVIVVYSVFMAKQNPNKKRKS